MLGAALTALALAPLPGPPTPSTFSIVAFDPTTGDLGVAVQSKFPCVGALVPHARAGVGAVATQAAANIAWGPRALELMEEGLDPTAVLERLKSEDPGLEERQIGIVDARGRAATFTGKRCFDWAGGKTGASFACQGNILAGAAVVEAMAEAFASSKSRFPERLVEALAAGQSKGGDRRGMQSAALLVVRAKGGYGGYTDRWIDLRVDDHASPIEELARLLGVHRLHFDKPDPSTLLPLTPDLVREIQAALARLGYYRGEVTGTYDDATRRGFSDWCGWENLEERFRADEKVDPAVLEALRAALAGSRSR
jgi:uncharacterized Ntn-hydrolase superfamily protein